MVVNRKLAGWATAFIFLAFSCAGCSTTEKQEPYTARDFKLDTEIIITIEDSQAPKICSHILQRITQIEKKMTLFSNDSEIARLNAQAGLKSVEVSTDTHYVLSRAVFISTLTQGAYDPTIGPLVKLWDIGSGLATVPSATGIQKAKALVDYKSLQINNDSGPSVLVTRPGQVVDLGGIAKGYAGDEAKRILLEHGVLRGIINLGGNVMAIGSKKDGSPWRVGIQNPLAPRGTYLGIVYVTDKAVVTSGGYERYFIKDGRRYHHIIDPATGYPADNSLISVTVVTKMGIDADALSTGAYVLGLTEGMKLIDSLDGVEAIFVTNDKKVYISQGLKNNYFQLTDEDFSYDE
ncbi:FAD:protein FMN transferase [Desulfoscipio gibsoniae]|uniref:FAD:protein FMN transferase n=1 Tax=Desulfoscipio gibsoniae DSM 7213 TaxID=767817 RepID=R4KJV0_9FIRM|nr:FAD:protein FMN transferase [Desulfoscipio gibsoniae]AGK99905.1 membrane-associated lipoprotein involved in thiamine biosynthesis [Desulfoscipio gibsoniae DSM 7213]